MLARIRATMRQHWRWEDEANFVHGQWGVSRGHDSDLWAQYVPYNGAPGYTSRPGLSPSFLRRPHNSRSGHGRVVANRSLFSSDWLASTKHELSLSPLFSNCPAIHTQTNRMVSPIPDTRSCAKSMCPVRALLAQLVDGGS